MSPFVVRYNEVLIQTERNIHDELAEVDLVFKKLDLHSLFYSLMTSLSY